VEQRGSFRLVVDYGLSVSVGGSVRFGSVRKVGKACCPRVDLQTATSLKKDENIVIPHREATEVTILHASKSDNGVLHAAWSLLRVRPT
jgi:hypothetical protein